MGMQPFLILKAILFIYHQFMICFTSDNENIHTINHHDPIFAAMDSSFGTIADYRSIIIINNEILLIPWRGVAGIADKTHAKVKGGEK